MVTFNYRSVNHWNPDLNRDGAANAMDKFPLRVRLFTDHEDFLKWPTGWPNHLADAGLNPATGGPVWDPLDPGYNIPDYIEGGAYIIDEGEAVYPLKLDDDPNEQDPHEMVSGAPGAYFVPFYYIISFGEAPYEMEFNLGYDPSYSGPGTAFDMTGTISPDTTIHASSGPNNFTASFDVPDGNYWAAARVTDNLGDSDVYMWAIDQVPCFPSDWVHTWGMSYYDYCYGSCADSQGNVYAVGYSADPAMGYDYGALIVKFNSAGDFVTAKKWGTTNYTEYCYGGVACDSNDNVFLNVRSYDSAGPGGADLAVVKFDSDLTCLGAKYWGYSGSDYAYGGIGIDSSDNVYIEGYVYNAPGGIGGYYDGAVVKFDNNLNFVDDKLCGTNYYDYYYNLFVDDNDEVFVSGYGYPFSGSSQYYDWCIVQMDDDLNKLNAITYGQTSYYDYGGQAVSDGDGNVYLLARTGSGQFSSYSYDAVVFKFNDSLVYQTGVWWGGSTYDYVQYYQPGDIADNGNVFMGGYSSSFSSTTYDFFVIEVDSAMNVVSEKVFDGSGSPYYCYGGMVSCAGNTPVLTGYRYDVTGNWIDPTTTYSGTPGTLVTNSTAIVGGRQQRDDDSRAADHGHLQRRQRRFGHRWRLLRLLRGQGLLRTDTVAPAA